ncbi:MAG TPA: RraA family protein [Steroidobacter sp.]
MHERELLDLTELANAGSVVVTDSLQLKSGLAAYLRPITSRANFCGRAVTVALEAGDNRAAYEALDILRADDVLVISCAETHDVAVVGGTLAGHCKNLGVVGIVTDGMIRDSAEIERLGMPVWARGIIPNAPGKLALGTVGEPVTIGNVVVATGDVLVADIDGITAVPQRPPAEFFEKLRLNLQRESAARVAVERGDRVPQWLRAIRSQDQVR